MVTTGLCSVLIFFISWNLGFGFKSVCQRLFHTKIHACIFEIFLSGVIVSYIYFNICSFFLAVDYKVLFPIFLLSVFITLIGRPFKTPFRALVQLIKKLKNEYLFLAVFLLSVLFVYWIIPPINGDSVGYHFLTIRWYEAFKVIPGLANLHGRFGFNPATFIISAPYAFTGILNQSLYAFNGVLILVFFLWILNMVASIQTKTVKIILIALMLLILRITLPNISSPSPDLLTALSAGYILIRLFLLARKSDFQFSRVFILFFILFFVVTIKLTLAPLLLFLPYLLLKSGGKFLHMKTLGFMGVLFVLIIIPWLIRNYLLSGYFNYPLPFSDFGSLSPDWKVPREVINLDYINARFEPYQSKNMNAIVNSTVVQRTKELFAGFFFEGERHILRWVEVLLALFSPVYWLFIRAKKIYFARSLMEVWVIIYIAFLIWLINDPEYRFGEIYIIFCYGIPFFLLFSYFFNDIRNNIFYLAAPAFFAIFSIYFEVKAFNFYQTSYPFSLKDCWWLPLKSIDYKPDQAASFTYMLLNDGKTKIYLGDNHHLCINAPSPCMPWYYGQIEMRGKEMEDGFRISKNGVNTDFFRK
jgi:hypothetical protein